MDADTFYNEFKAALKYLEVPWGNMSVADVVISGDCICIAHENRSISFQVNYIE